MTDNEIIKALECCSKNEPCNICSYDKKEKDEFVCCSKLMLDAFDLINRQKAEIERFKNRQKPTGASGYKIENGKVVFFTNMLGGCKVIKENLEEVVKTLNELLQECYSKDEIAFALKCKTEELKTAKAEAIKEFAERLKETSTRDAGVWWVMEEDIDNLAKEMVGGAK